jgi:hypothetical protein
VPFGVHRPTTTVTRTVTLAVVLSVPVLVTAVAARFWSTQSAGLCMVAAVVTAIVSSGQLVRARKLIMVFAGVCAIMAAILALIGTPLLVLRLYGQQTEATVVAARRVHAFGGADHRYLLLMPNGQPISRELSESHDVYAVGDQVDVVFDPGGRVDPADTDLVNDASATLAFAVGCQIAALVLCVPAVRLAGNDKPPRRTRHGLWIFER